MANIITAQDISDFAPDLDYSAFSAATMSGIISQATTRAEGFCNVAGFDLTTETGETDRAVISNDGELVITPRRVPVVSLTSVSLVKGQFSSTLTLTSAGANLYQVPYGNKRIHIPNAYLVLTGTLLAGGSSQLLTLKGAKTFTQTTYIGGYQSIPADLKEAIVLYARDIINRKFNAEGLKRFSQGSYSEEYDTTSQTGKSEVIEQAENILRQGDYVRVTDAIG